MSEIVERVARAIASRRAEIMLGADPATQTADERELARSAIAAMREPNEQMLIHAFMTVDHTIEPMAGHPDAHDQIKALWQDMVDEALK